MWSQITIENIDPIERVTLALVAGGASTLEGGSATGKSVTLACLMAPFTGDVPPLRPGAERGFVELATTKGERVRADVTKSGVRWSWAQAGGADLMKAASHAELLRAPLVSLSAAKDHDLVRVIMDPVVWEELLTTDLGRPLRDLLMRILPPADLSARVVELAKAAGHEVTPADLVAETTGKGARTVPPTDPDYPTEIVSTLARRQTEANAAKERATGQRDEAARRLSELRGAKVEAPASPEALAAAETTVKTAAAWAAHDAASAAYGEASARVKAQREANAAWKTALAKLGVEPKADPKALADAQAAIDKARAEVKRADDEAREAARVAAQKEADARVEAARIEATKAAEAKAAAEAARVAAQAAEVPKPVAPDPTPAAEVYSPDYRRGFGDAVEAAASIVQWCRENGETDHRSMLWPIRSLTPENQSTRETEEDAP